MRDRMLRWLVILAKSSKFIKVAKALKFLKLTKPLVTFVSMSLSAFVYAFWLGPLFSLGFVFLLFLHEMGHVAALRKKGFNTGAPVFIPMLGAVIFCPPIDDPDTEAYVGYGGPLFGAIASFLVAGLWLVWPGNSQLLLTLAYTSAFINLFNLIPIRPLDGGRVAQAVGKWYKYVGVTFLFLLTLYVREPGILLIWILVLGDLTISKKFRTRYGIACEASMILLMILGYGEQGWIANAVDILLASMFNATYVFQELKVKEAEVVRKELPASQRIKWLSLYVALSVVLVLLMILLVPYLPDAVRNSQ